MKNKKLKVLIVEDEYRIGMLIKKFIDWDRLNLEFIDCVNNGLKALELINLKRPDIVITDIQMPIINGLELISRTSDMKPNIEYIVISGYKDFEYAHTALQYGVNSYLLKPIKKSELNESLEKIVSNVNKTKLKSAEDKKIREEIIKTKKIINSNILREIIEGREVADISYINSKYEVDFRYELFRIIDIKLDYRDKKRTDKKQDIITLEKVMKVIDKGINDEHIKKVVYVDCDLNIFCMFNYNNFNKEKINKYINMLLISLEEYLLGFEQYEVTIGIGLEKNDLKYVKDSYKEALKAVRNRVSIGTRKIIYYKHFGDDNYKKIDEIFEDYIKDYENYIISYNDDGFREIVKNIFDKLNTLVEIENAHSYYYLTEKLINIFFNNIKKMNNNSDDLKAYVLRNSNHCYSELQLRKLILFELGDYLLKCKHELETKLTKPIREAKKYIEKNWDEKITLDKITKIVNLNPVYFSVIFKKETGLNFSDYIVKFKMDKAKEMLKKENQTVAAVAEKLGYKDSRYFSKLFYKTVGLKPTVFRKLYS